MFAVYFAKSLKNGKIYVGLTSKEVKERIKDHNYGSSKWSKQNGPFELVYFEKYYCKQDALQREKFYKSGFGRQIRNAILKIMGV